MGLDVYLYKRTQPREKITADEAELEQFASKAWDFGGRKYDDLTPAEIESARAACETMRSRMGYVGYDHPGDLRVSAPPSKKWPDHICKLDYLRSSYNGSGLNSCLDRFGLPDLYAIFGVGNDENDVDPDWTASLERARDVLARYRPLADGLDIQEVRAGFVPPLEGHEAHLLETVRAELSRERPGGSEPWSNWSNGSGDFWAEGLTIVATVRGKPGFLGTGVYLVTKRAMTPETDWTAQALEIVVEMCEWVLAQPDPQSLHFHWSA